MRRKASADAARAKNKEFFNGGIQMEQEKRVTEPPKENRKMKWQVFKTTTLVFQFPGLSSALARKLPAPLHEGNFNPVFRRSFLLRGELWPLSRLKKHGCLPVV